LFSALEPIVTLSRLRASPRHDLTSFTANQANLRAPGRGYSIEHDCGATRRASPFPVCPSRSLAGYGIRQKTASNTKRKRKGQTGMKRTKGVSCHEKPFSVPRHAELTIIKPNTDGAVRCSRLVGIRALSGRAGGLASGWVGDMGQRNCTAMQPFGGAGDVPNLNLGSGSPPRSGGSKTKTQ